MSIMDIYSIVCSDYIEASNDLMETLQKLGKARGRLSINNYGKPTQYPSLQLTD